MKNHLIKHILIYIIYFSACDFNYTKIIAVTQPKQLKQLMTWILIDTQQSLVLFPPHTSCHRAQTKKKQHTKVMQKKDPQSGDEFRECSELLGSLHVFSSFFLPEYFMFRAMDYNDQYFTHPRDSSLSTSSCPGSIPSRKVYSTKPHVIYTKLNTN